MGDDERKREVRRTGKTPMIQLMYMIKGQGARVVSAIEVDVKKV